MSMVIAKGTDAADSAVLHVAASASKPATFVVAGDLVAEEIDIYVVDEDGATNLLYDGDGVAIVLSATSAPLSLYAPVWLQFSKPSTANAVGVMQVN